MYSLQKAFQLHSNIYKAMANHKRLEVINLLRDRELTVNEIAKMLGIKQANLSQHLCVLRQAGIVNTRRKGLHIYYRLVSPNIVKAQDLIREVLLKQLDEKEIAQSDLKDAFNITTDPVCKMHINSITASDKIKFNDKIIYFCGKGCRRKFTKNPKEYLL